MSVNSWEQQYLAGIFVGEISLDSFITSGLEAKHFSSPSLKPIVKVMRGLTDRKLEVTQDTVYTQYCLDNGKGHLADSIKSTLEGFERVKLDGAKFSEEFLLQKKTEYETTALVNMASDAIVAGDVDSARSILADYQNITRVTDGYKLTDLFNEDSWDERHVERNAVKDGQGNFQFLDHFSDFNRYFEVGVERQTISAIAGATNVGKSIFLFNIALQTVDPRNGLNTLILKTENRWIQGVTRWDSIFLDMPGHQLRDVDPKAQFSLIEEKVSEGWGRAFLAKMPVKGCTTDMIYRILDDIYKLHGVEIDAICIDSPDHMDPVTKTKAERWIKKADVYMDLKSLGEQHDSMIITSLPLKPSTVGKSWTGSEGTAGSYDIARLVDFQMNMNKSEEDIVLGRRTLQLAKTREGEFDGRDFYFRITPSLRFEPWIKPEEKRDKEYLVGGYDDDKEAVAKPRVDVVYSLENGT